MDAIKFTTQAPERKAGRFTLASAVPTADGGRVGVGVDRQGGQSLVYEIGHAQAGTPMHAVATAVVGGIIPLDALVSAFKAAGSLDALAASVKKATGK